MSYSLKGGYIGDYIAFRVWDLGFRDNILNQMTRSYWGASGIGRCLNDWNRVLGYILP